MGRRGEAAGKAGAGAGNGAVLRPFGIGLVLVRGWTRLWRGLDGRNRRLAKRTDGAAWMAG